MNRRLCTLCVVALLCVTTSFPAFAGGIKANSEAAAQRVRLRILATAFLDKATFGGQDADVDGLVQRMEQIGEKPALEEWIDDQFALQPSYLEPLAKQMMADDGVDPLANNAWVQRYRHHAFWHNAMAAPDQLRQRIAWALIQICVINDGMFNNRALDVTGELQYLAPLHYYDQLIKNASRSYRDVVLDVSLHPCMGNFLSALRNRKANLSVNRFPDENYAREVMQLFTIGLYELNADGSFKKAPDGSLIETYDNEDIKAFARVFTGLKYAVGPGGNTNTIWTPANFHAPMEGHEPEHDTDPKTLLNGAVLPGGQTMLQDVNGAIDNLVNHPNIAPFIGRRLIQRMVKSNPSKGHLSRVTQAWQNTNGDMKAVIKAILLDDDVMNAISFNIAQTGPATWTVNVSDNGTEDSRLNEPMVRYTAFLRKFNAAPDYPTGRFMLADMKYHWTQGFMASPSVFNFYLPDHQPAGDIVSYNGSTRMPNGTVHAPEFENETSVVLNRAANRYRWEIYSEKSIHWLLNNGTYSFKNEMTLDFSEAKSLASNPEALVDHLNVKLAHGNLDDSFRQNLIDALSQETTNATSRARAAILSVIVAPQTAVTR
ncbi:MAG: DUF1800 family protein [Planctomycetaceae bacterium]